MNFSQFSYLWIFGLWKPSICVRILLLVGLITPYLQAQDIDCIRTVVPLVGGQGQMTPQNQIPVGTIGGANDKQYYPNLYAVEYYRPDVFYTAGGGTNPLPFGPAANDKLVRGNEIIRVRIGDDAVMHQYPISMGPHGMIQTNAFGADAKNNIIVSMDLYDKRLLDRNYPNNTKPTITAPQRSNCEAVSDNQVVPKEIDTVYGFLISRKNNANSGWQDESYIYAFKAANPVEGNGQLDGFILRAGKTKIQLKTFGQLDFNNGVQQLVDKDIDADNTGNYSSDKMRAVITIDKDKAWAVGYGVIKLFNGKIWTKFSADVASNNQAQQNAQTQNQVQLDQTNQLPVEPQKSTEENKQVCNFPKVQLNALAGRMENRDDPDTVWAVGDKGTLVRIIYTLDPANAATTTVAAPAVGNTNCNACAIGNCQVEHVKEISIVYKTNDNGQHNCNANTGQNNADCEIGKGLPADKNILSVSYAGDNVLYVGVADDGLYKSTDGGKNFTKVTISGTYRGVTVDGSSSNLNAMGFASSKDGYIVGSAAQSNQIASVFRYNCVCDPNNAGGTNAQNNCSARFFEDVDISLLDNCNQLTTKPNFNAVSFLSNNLGIIVGDNGFIIHFRPSFRIACDAGGVANRKPATRYNSYPASVYDLNGSISANTQLTLCSADVLRCGLNVPNRTVTQCDCNQWDKFISNRRDNENSNLPGFGNCDCALDVFKSNCPDPTGTNKRKYTDVYVDAVAITDAKWKLLRRPAEYEIFLLDTNQNPAKSPEYKEREVAAKDDPSRWSITYNNGNNISVTSFTNGKKYIKLQNLPKGVVNQVTAVQPQQQQQTVVVGGGWTNLNNNNSKSFTYDYAKHLKPYYCFISGGRFPPDCKSPNNQNNQFAFRIRALIPNFSLSPSFDDFIFGVGEGFVDKRAVRVVRPALVPYMYAPKASKEAYCLENGGNRTDKSFQNGYAGALDSFLMPTNTAYKLEAIGDIDVKQGQFSSQIPEIYELMIDKIKGKVEDTPLLRRSKHYDTVKPDHDQVWVNLRLKHNYINSFKASADEVAARITGPHYNPYMRRSVQNRNNADVPIQSTALMPEITVGGVRLPEAHDMDAHGNFIGDPVKKVVTAQVPGGPAVGSLIDDKTKPPNLRLHLANGTLYVPNVIDPPNNALLRTEATKNDILSYISRLRPDQLPTKRFPKIVRTRVCISRAPLSYQFSFNKKSVDGQNVKDGDLVNVQNGGKKWVSAKSYDNRTEKLETMRFKAGGQPITDTIFKVKLDARYGYRIGAIYDQRNAFLKDHNDKRFHYYLLKKKGKNANDSVILRGHPPLAQQPPPAPTVTPGEFFIDTIRIWNYDTIRKSQNGATTTAQAGAVGTGTAAGIVKTEHQVLLDMEEWSILVRQNYSNYMAHDRVDTVTYFVNGYGYNPSPATVLLRKIRFLRVLQEAALLRLGKDPKAKPNANKVNVSLGYARDSVKKDTKNEVVRGKRDSVFVRSNVKWYVKTKRHDQQNNRVPNDPYGKGFGVWWDTLDGGSAWTNLKAVKPDIPKDWPKTNNGAGANNDDLRVALANDDDKNKPPYFKILFKALKSNLTDKQRKDSIEVCALGDSVCSIVYIVQDTPRLNVQLLTNSYRDLRTKRKAYTMFTGFKKDQAPHIRTRDSMRVRLADLGEWRLIDSGCYRDKKGQEKDFKKVSELPVMNSTNTEPKTYIPIWLDAQKNNPDYADDTITLANSYKNLSDSQRHCVFKVCAISWECALNKKDSLNSKRKYCQKIDIIQDTATIKVKMPRNESDPVKGNNLVPNDGYPTGGFDGDGRAENLVLPYFLGARSAICIGSDGDIEVEMPSFLKIVPCSNNNANEKPVCNKDSNDTKKVTLPPAPPSVPEMKPENACLFQKGDTPNYNSANNCPTDDKFELDGNVKQNNKTTIKKFKHQFQGEPELDHCRPYCVEVVNRNESKKERSEKLKITVLGTNKPVVREVNVVQEGIKIDLKPTKIELGRRMGARDKFTVSTNAVWELNNYDRSYYQFNPNSNGNKRVLDKAPFAVNLESLKDNELDGKNTTEVLVTPTDVCQVNRDKLSEKLTIIQDSFWFRYTLIPTPYEPKYPEIVQEGARKIYQVPAPQNKYLRFLVESNAVWTVGGTGGIHNQYRSVLKPSSGISPYDIDTLLIKVEDLQNFLKGRDDSLDLGIIRRNGSILWRDKIYYRQKPYDFEENNLVLYPNPVTSRLYIRSVNGFKNGYVFIYNLNGELIAKRNYNDGLIDFDFGTLPIGVYIIRVYDGNVFVTKKIIRH